MWMCVSASQPPHSKGQSSFSSVVMPLETFASFTQYVLFRNFVEYYHQHHHTTLSHFACPRARKLWLSVFRLLFLHVQVVTSPLLCWPPRLQHNCPGNCRFSRSQQTYETIITIPHCLPYLIESRDFTFCIIITASHCYAVVEAMAVPFSCRVKVRPASVVCVVVSRVVRRTHCSATLELHYQGYKRMNKRQCCRVGVGGASTTKTGAATWRPDQLHRLVCLRVFSTF